MATVRVVRLTVVMAALLVLGWCRESTASAPDDLMPLATGTRIRLDAPRFRASLWRPIVGAFHGTRMDTLEVLGNVAGEGRPSLIAIPLSSIDEVQRWSGKKGNGRMGMLVGLVVGAGVAALATSGQSDPPDTYGGRVGAVVVCGLGGMLWGGLLGSQIKTDRWEDVPLSAGGR